MVGILTTMFKRPSRQSLLDFEVALSYIFVDSTLRSFTHLTDTSQSIPLIHTFY